MFTIHFHIVKHRQHVWPYSCLLTSVMQVYGVSLAANLVLLVGLLLPNTEKLLLVPWLLAHTLLVMALMAAALYYLGA